MYILETKLFMEKVLVEYCYNFKVILTNGLCTIIKMPKYHIILGENGKVKHVRMVYKRNKIEKNMRLLSFGW